MSDRTHRLLGTLILLFAPALAGADECLLAVASNFMPAMTEMVGVFEKQTGHAVKVAYGSSGKFYAQIRAGAPFEAFLSADQDKPQALERDGLAVPGSRFTYAVGRLVLWSARDGFVDAGGKVLAEGRFTRLALANPALAPYGVAAVEVLEKLGLVEATRARWVQGENIAQAFLFVDSGNAELGFVALSQVLEGGAVRRGSAWQVPEDLHQPIRQDAVLLLRGNDRPVARAFLEFLRTPVAQAIIVRQGYAAASRGEMPTAFD